MKTSTLRTFRALHTWVGIGAGLALFIAFYAGAITVFTHELHAWESNHREATAKARQIAPVDDAVYADAERLIEAVLARHPEAKSMLRLTLPSEHQPELILRWDEPLAEGGRHRHLFKLSPSGELVSGEPKSRLVRFIYRLHYTAGIPLDTWGLYFMGVICVLYGMALVSGIVIYAPVFFSDLFALRWGKNIKRLWQDAHNVIGTLSLPFHVIFAWSGAVLAIGALLLAPFQFLVYDGQLLKIIDADRTMLPRVSAAGVAAEPQSLADLVTRAQAEHPALQISMLRVHEWGDANGQLDVYGRVDSPTVTQIGGVAVNLATGEVNRVLAPDDYTPGTTFLRGLQSLHFGNFGDVALQWLYFVLGMIGAFLFYSGNLLWIEARRRRRSSQQPASGVFMARLTLGVCLGCISGVSAIFIANKCLPAGLGDKAVWEERTYYGVFLLSIGWAFLRPPARAGYELLLACAALTAAIPLANAWRTGDFLLQTLFNRQWQVFGVDALALLFAWGYWRMAQATLRRARRGNPNSVWALDPSAGQALEEASLGYSQQASK